MVRILCSVLVLLLLASPAFAGFECPVFRRGDVDASGDLNINDPIRALTFLFSGGDDLDCLDAADSDDDGAVNVSDAVFLLLYLFSGGKPTASPGPENCGFDQTEDDLECAVSTCLPIASTVDLSGFNSLHFTLFPGLGFCPDEGEFYSVEIQRTEDENYLFDFSVVAEATDEEEECLFDLIGERCLVARPGPQRELEPEEVAQLLDEMSSVEVMNGSHPACQCIAFDPCLIREFRWEMGAEETVRASDFLCGETHMSGTELNRLLSVLKSMAQPF